MDAFIVVLVVLAVVIAVAFLLASTNGGTSGFGSSSGSCLCPAGSYGSFTAVLNTYPALSSPTGVITVSLPFNKTGNRYLVVENITITGLTSPVTRLVLWDGVIYTPSWEADFDPMATVNGTFSASGIVASPQSNDPNDALNLIFLQFDEQGTVTVGVATQNDNLFLTGVFRAGSSPVPSEHPAGVIERSEIRLQEINTVKQLKARLNGSPKRRSG